MKKYYTATFFLLAILAFSVPTDFVFASEGSDDDRYDDDRSGDSSKTSGFSEREVRSENLGFQTEISIEIEFVSSTTDTNQLIDEIIDRFSLTREDADKQKLI